MLCLAICETVLKNIRKNVFKNLTEMLLFPDRSGVAERTWRLYCCGYRLVSNVMTTFKYHISKRNVAFVNGEFAYGES